MYVCLFSYLRGMPNLASLSFIVHVLFMDLCILFSKTNKLTQAVASSSFRNFIYLKLMTETIEAFVHPWCLYFIIYLIDLNIFFTVLLTIK